MKTLLILLSLILLIGLIGCDTESTAEIIKPPVVKPLPVEPDENYKLSPPKIKIGNIAPGGMVDEELAGLSIENGFAETITLCLAYSATDEITTDIDTGLTYAPTPKEAVRWVSFLDGEVNIPARSIMTIPVRLSIPKDIVNLPPRWEFDIKVSEPAGGFIQTALVQRWLITMR
jgi:hypothetical protein